jgi:hypothetical protein
MATKWDVVVVFHDGKALAQDAANHREAWTLARKYVRYGIADKVRMHVVSPSFIREAYARGTSAPPPEKSVIEMPSSPLIIIP